MPYSDQNKFFETAYKTGSDIWTNKLYQKKVFEYLHQLPDGAMVLDIGTGRGRWPYSMVELGFKVIGLDNVKDLMKINNKEAATKGLQGKIRFVEGDVFDIGFQDGSFDVVTDFGLVQHLRPDDWSKYGSEVSRVLRNGGFILNVSFSKQTRRFFEFKPKESTESDFIKYGVFNHFFVEEEIKQIYGRNFKVIKQEHIYIEENGETLLFSLLQKN